jgi:hypothetical protein
MDHWGNHESGMPPERFKASTMPPQDGLRLNQLGCTQ